MFVDDPPGLGEETVASLVAAIRNVGRHPVFPFEGIKTEDLLVSTIGLSALTQDALSQRD
jgi:hypothetical protein